MSPKASRFMAHLAINIYILVAFGFRGYKLRPCPLMSGFLLTEYNAATPIKYLLIKYL